MMFHLLLSLQMGAAAAQCATEPPGSSSRTFAKASSTPAEQYSGRLCELQVSAPRLQGDVHVDGLLDEPVWQRAAVLHGFSEYKPVDGREAEDSTQVLVWYSDNAIYFGVRAFESHVALNPRLADRDKIDAEDYVQLLLDTFHDKRRAMVFGVSPLGVQADGVRSEGGAAVSGGGFGTQQDLSGMDLNPDFVYQSKGRVTDFGYQVEIRVPFKTLRFQGDRVQDWGFNVIRKVQHSGHEQTWTQARQGTNSFLSQSGTLVGLTDLHRGLVLDLTPVVTSKSTGTRVSPTSYSYDTPLPQIGGNVRWGITPNLALTGTIKPDFSQVEADVAQIQALPRNALFFAEKRPFFLEGIEQFQTPIQIIYTRRIVSPVTAAKLTGKVSGTNVAFLSAVDDRSLSLTTSNPIYNLLRVRRDLGSKSWIGAVATDKEDGGTFNRVAGVDSRIVFGKYYYLQFQAAGSVTRGTPGVEERLRPLYQVVLDRTGRAFGFTARTTGLHPEFIAASGFFSRPSIFQSNLGVRYTLFGKPGKFLESVTYSTSVDGLWDYRNFFNGTNADETKFHHNFNFSFRGGWRFGPFLFAEDFYYPPAGYTNYRLEHKAGARTDTVPFTAGNQTLRNYDVGFGLSTPRYARWDASANILGGPDDNFFEWQRAFIWLTTFVVNVRPTDRIRIENRFVHQTYRRWNDHTYVATRNIPRIKMEYQLSRPIFLRFVGQYDAAWQDALRDDGRTNDPILIFNPATKRYERALEKKSNNFRGDVLFSYQPNPGTVIFAGYGSTLTEADAFRFRELNRSTDGFFMKISYLFRL
jgi:hypothetical protein